MPYGRFLAANASGGIVWATGITYLIWFLGLAAEQWMSRLSWFGLAAAVLTGLGITLLVRRKTRALTRQAEAQAEAEARAEAAEEAQAKAGASPPAPHSARSC
jgi:membrane protein DedA with SNARE-associated domain